VGSLFRLILIAVLGVVAFGVLVIAASESGEVVVLRTSEPAGPTLETRVWVVDDGIVPWLRAGEPTASWLTRLRVNPDVEMVRDGEAREYFATPADDPEIRDWINHRMAEKYGWADWIVGLFTDRNESVPIRLDPR
jgi:hypothetical protein